MYRGVRTHNIFARTRHSEGGATAVEYGIMIALIASVIIGVVSTLGGNLSDLYAGVASHFGAAAVPGDNTELQCDEDGSYIGPQLWVETVWYSHTDPDTYDTISALRVVHKSGTSWFLQGDEGMVAAADPGLSSEDITSGEWVGFLPADAEAVAGDPALTAAYSDGFTSEPAGVDGSFASGSQGCPNENWNHAEDAWQAANCDADGNYTGGTDNWYWTREDLYQNGTLTTDAGGTHWVGKRNPSPYAWAERGAMTGTTLWGDPAWGKVHNEDGSTIRATWVQFENGGLWVTAPDGTPEPAYGLISPTVPDSMNFHGALPTGYPDANGYTAQWVPNSPRLYTEDEKGDFFWTNWIGSPDAGGVKYAKSPAQPGDNEVLHPKYSCS